MTVSGGRSDLGAHVSSGVRNSLAKGADSPIVLPRLPEKFKVTGRHAEGAICEVFKAHHTALDIAVAVKVLRPEFADDRRFLERMRVEAQVLSRFKHPHIPLCFDCGFTLDGRPYTVLEFLRGDTLEALLAQAGRFDEPSTIELGCALLGALGAAHARGVVHRDVSLRNLIVHRTEHEPPTLKLIDFGFAWITPDAPESAPEPAEPDHDTAVGTPRFTSPEVALGYANIDGRADLYSTGVVLYTLLAGRDPFAELETAEAVLEAHAHRAPPSLSRLVPGVSPDLEAVVMRLLEKDPVARFASAGVAVQALSDSCQTIHGLLTGPPSASVLRTSSETISSSSVRQAPTMITRRVDSLLLLRQTDRDPSDEAWNECLELLDSGIDAYHRVNVLVQTEGGRPTFWQRQRLGRITRKGDVRVAVVSESTKVRFGVSVVALMEMKIRTFLTAELPAAFNHLGLSQAECALAETHLAEMATLLRVTECPDLAAGQSRDDPEVQPFDEPMAPPPTVPPSESDRRPVGRAPKARTQPGATSVGLESPVIRAFDGNHLVATWDNVLIQIWSGEVRPQAVEGIMEIERALIGEKGSAPLGLVFIVEQTSPQPSETARAALSTFFRDLSPSFVHRLVVAEGSAFRIASVRSVGVQLSSLCPEPIPFTFTNSVQQTAELIAPVLSPESGGAIGFVLTLMKLREEISLGDKHSADDSERHTG